MHIGQRVKYAHPDAYPGFKKPTEIIPGENYTVSGTGEYPKDHGLYGDTWISVDDSGNKHGSKRFEPTNSKKVAGISF